MLKRRSKKLEKANTCQPRTKEGMVLVKPVRKKRLMLCTAVLFYLHWKRIDFSLTGLETKRMLKRRSKELEKANTC